MGQVITIYYAFCTQKEQRPGKYLGYQRVLADNILNHGFKNRFGIGFDREKVTKGRNGKPNWAGEGEIGFNVSNTNGLVVCGVSGTLGQEGMLAGRAGSGRGSLGIGVDAEKPRKVRMPVLQKCCSPEEICYILGRRAVPVDGIKDGKGGDGPGFWQEGTFSIEGNWGMAELGEDVQQRFSQIWTLKESYIKMTGEGLAFPLKEVNFKVEKKINGGFDIMCNQPAFFAQRQIKGYWVSLCAKGQAEVVWEEIPVDGLQ